MLANAGNSKFLLVRGASVATALIVFLFCFQSYLSKKEYFNDVNNQLTTQTNRFKTLNDMTLLVTEYENKFMQYMPVKQYEEENRLHWLDSLDAIRLKYKIPRLNYSISVRQPYDYQDGLIKERGLKVFVSDIKLSMSLMHEAELISVARDLKNIKSSVHVLTSCEMKRKNQSSVITKANTQPNIEASCNIKWFTFKAS